MPIPSQTGSGSLGRGWTPGATRPACMSGADGNRTRDILLAKRRRTIRWCPCWLSAPIAASAIEEESRSQVPTGVSPSDVRERGAITSAARDALS